MLTYNQAGTVADAVRAAVAQNGPLEEILISDDCSSDQTFDVIKRTVENYNGPHKVVLNQNPKNLGINKHLNVLNQLSSGNVIIAASGDDISLPDRSERIIRVFETERTMLVHSDAIVENSLGEPASHPFRNALFFHSTDVKRAAVSKALYLGATCAWHKDLYAKYGPMPENQVFDDLILGFRAALEEGVHTISEPLIRYRIGQGVTTVKTSVKSIQDIQDLRETELDRELATLQHRREDCTVLGGDVISPIVEVIDARVKYLEIRKLAARQGLLGTIMRHPTPNAIHAALAEMNSYRKLMSNLKKNA